MDSKGVEVPKTEASESEGEGYTSESEFSEASDVQSDMGGMETDDLNGSDAEMEDDLESMDEHSFQKTVWTLSKLPYAGDLDEEADEYFRAIKAGLAQSILLHDTKTRVHYMLELQKYVVMYSLRFTKEDHVTLLKLLSSFIVKGGYFRDVRIAIRTMRDLLKKRDCLSRSDIQFNWKQFYDLYIEVAYGELEEDGLFMLPENFKADLAKLIRSLRDYWHDSATQEILDEMRPLLCPWDESMVRSMRLLQMFIPTTLSFEEHSSFGAVLWADEMWHWFTAIENNSLVEQFFVHLFARLARDCPRFVNWEDRLDIIFTKILRSLRIGKGTGMNQTFPMQNAAVWMVYMLGTEEKSQTLISRLFAVIESFLHPSNHGTHTAYLLNCIFRLSHEMVNRVKRERVGHPLPLVPPEYRLTQKIIDDFVSSALPCVRLAIFTKKRQEFVPHIVKSLMLLSPGLVAPPIIDLIYPALETVTEPHRLTQALHCLFVSVIPLLRNESPTIRGHIIPIIEALIPAIDPNDIQKCLLCFQVIGTVVNTVPFADSSDAIHLRDDLTDEEKELCSQTANFEGIALSLIDRMISLFEFGSVTVTGQHGTLLKQGRYNIEENIFHDGVRMVFKGITSYSSVNIYKVVVDRLYLSITDRICDSHVVASTLCELVALAIKARPELSFHRFLSLVLRRLKELVTEEVCQEEKVDFTVTWWLAIAGGLFRVTPPFAVQYKKEIAELLRIVLPIRCTNGMEFTTKIFLRVLRSLTQMAFDVDRELLENLDKGVADFLPIRMWACPLDRDKFNVEKRWVLPTKESIDFARELMDEFLAPCLAALAKPDTLSRPELLRELRVVEVFVSAAAASLPFFDSPPVPATKTVTPILSMQFRTYPKDTPLLTLPEGTIRGRILKTILSTVEVLLSSRESEVKAISIITNILTSLIFDRGTDRDKLTGIVQTHRVARVMMGDRLSGARGYIKVLAEEAIHVAHQNRVMTKSGYHLSEEHVQIVNTLIRLSTSSYSENRIKAQAHLSRILREHPHSYELFVDHMLSLIDAKNNPAHHQLKGGLYMLVDHKRYSLVLRQNWSTMLKTWPAIIRITPSEKPSILKLLETASNTIVEHFESLRIEEIESTETQRVLAKALVASGGKHFVEFTPLSEEREIVAEKERKEREENNLASYRELCSSLLSLSNDSSLHWRYLELAQGFLSMLVRMDQEIPDEVVQLYARTLVHDTLKIRRMSLSFLGSWLKITKPKAIKRPMPVPFKEPNRSEGARWPIEYGFREDNRCMLYDPEKLPTADNWNNYQFCGKMHWGFYVWPKELVTYAPIVEQLPINRKEDSLSPIDRFMLDTLRNPTYMNRLCELLSMEEKKGEDKFNVVVFAFFHGLCRNYNDMLLPILMEQLEKLTQGNEEGQHRLATEIVAGLVDGSKMWTHDKVENMWRFLVPFLTRVFSNVKDQTQKNWGTCLACISGSLEARALRPLIDLLFELLEKDSDNCDSYHTTARLFLLQSTCCQFEWRVTALWRRAAPILFDLMSHPYQNVRERLGSILVSSTWYDLPSVSVSPSLQEILRPMALSSIFDQFDPLLGEVWDEVNLAETDNNHVANPSTSESHCDDPKKRSSRFALRSLVMFIFNYYMQTLGPLSLRVFRYVPLFAHFCNEVSDEELRLSSQNVMTELNSAYINKHNVTEIIQLFKSHLNGRYWWKSKMIMLSQFRGLVFANLFTFQPYREDVYSIIMEMMRHPRLEVRDTAGAALSLLVHASFLPVTSKFIDQLSSDARSTELSTKHSGVLGLAAIVSAFPYTIPSFLPTVLSKLCSHGREKEPIKDTVKKTLSEFRRTHQDCWHEHKLCFTEDQLTELADFTVSPNYYV